MKRTIHRLAAVFALTVIFFTCAGVSFAESLSDEMITNETGAMVRTVTYKSADKSTTWLFDEKYQVGDIEYKLQEVKYSITDTVTSRFEHAEKMQTWLNLYTKDVPQEVAYTLPDTDATVQLPLISVEYQRATITGREETVTSAFDFGFLTYAPTPEQSRSIDYYDAPSGRTVTGTVRYTNMTLADPWEWRDVAATATFYSVASPYYEIGTTGVYLDGSGAAPNIAGKEAALIAAIGQNVDTFKINSATWAGEAVEENGVMVRRATLQCSQYNARYVANYSATWKLPDAPGYTGIAIYGGQIDVLSGRAEFTIMAVATYTLPLTLSTAARIVIGAVGLAIIVGAALFILYMIRKRREENECEGKQGKKYKKHMKLKVHNRKAG